MLYQMYQIQAYCYCELIFYMQQYIEAISFIELPLHLLIIDNLKSSVYLVLLSFSSNATSPKDLYASTHLFMIISATPISLPIDVYDPLHFKI